jgi:hypothetical protein
MATGGPKKSGGHNLNLMRRDMHDPRKTFRYFNDFFTLPIDDTTSHILDWEFVEDAGAAWTIADKRGGWLNLVTDGTNEDEVYIATRAQAFIFNTTDEVMFECEVANTAAGAAGDAGFIVGLSDTVAANSILDTGLIMASFDGACFILEENAEVAFVTSNAATPVRTATAYDWTDGDTVRLGFYYDPNDGTTAKVTPVVNGVDGTAHDLTISGLEEMNILLGCKAHSANAQTLEIDWVEAIQRRNAAADIGGL